MNRKIEVLVVTPEGYARYETVDATAPAIKVLLGGGWLEGIASDGKEWICYGDDEAANKGYPFNPVACLLVNELDGTIPIQVYGPVVFVGLLWAGVEDGYVEGDVPPVIRNAVAAFAERA